MPTQHERYADTWVAGPRPDPATQPDPSGAGRAGGAAWREASRPGEAALMNDNGDRAHHRANSVPLCAVRGRRGGGTLVRSEAGNG